MIWDVTLCPAKMHPSISASKPWNASRPSQQPTAVAATNNRSHKHRQQSISQPAQNTQGKSGWVDRFSHSTQHQQQQRQKSSIHPSNQNHRYSTLLKINIHLPFKRFTVAQPRTYVPPMCPRLVSCHGNVGKHTGHTSQPQLVHSLRFEFSSSSKQYQICTEISLYIMPWPMELIEYEVRVDVTGLFIVLIVCTTCTYEYLPYFACQWLPMMHSGIHPFIHSLAQSFVHLDRRRLSRHSMASDATLLPEPKYTRKQNERKFMKIISKIIRNRKDFSIQSSTCSISL